MHMMFKLILKVETNRYGARRINDKKISESLPWCVEKLPKSLCKNSHVPPIRVAMTFIYHEKRNKRERGNAARWHEDHS